MNKYAYVRVSTSEQKIDRQVYEMEIQGVSPENIYIDKQSGKDFDRPAYKKLLRKLKKDDLVIIHSIDRLGRNYDGIIEQWAVITKKIGANIFVIDMPLLDTREKENGLTAKLISDIVLQLLSYVAQVEREKIKQRQAEGIRIAKQQGRHLGRPKFKVTNDFKEICLKYDNGLSQTECANKLGIARATFLKYYREAKG